MREQERARRECARVREELRDYKQLENRLVADNAEMQTENGTLQRQLSSLRSRQVEFESLKLEVRQLADQKSCLASELEDVRHLCEILEHENADALRNLEAERENRLALKRELDQHEQAASERRISHLASSFGLSARGADSDAEEEAESGATATHPPQPTGNGERSDSLFDELQNTALLEKLSVLRRHESELVERLSAADEQLVDSRSRLERLSDAFSTVRQLCNIAAGDGDSGQCIADDVLDILVRVDEESSGKPLEGASQSESLATLRAYRTRIDTAEAKVKERESELSLLQSDLSMFFVDIAERQRVVNRLSESLGVIGSQVADVDRELAEANERETSPTTDEEQRRNEVTPPRLSDLFNERLQSSFGLKLTLQDPLVTEVHAEAVDLERSSQSLRRAVEGLSGRVATRIAEAKNSTAEQTNAAAKLAREQSANEVRTLREQNRNMRALVKAQKEQIATLKDSLSKRNLTAETAIASLIGKYDSEKVLVAETMAKMRQELNQRKE